MLAPIWRGACNNACINLGGCMDLQMPTYEWSVWGKIHTLLLIMTLEYAESGSTTTLYAHGLTHVWDLQRLPIQASDEAGERALRWAKRFAECTSTNADASAQDTMTHELYMMLLRKVRKRSQIPIWRPVCRPLILEPCITGGRPEWRDACLQVLKDWQSVLTLLVLIYGGPK